MNDKMQPDPQPETDATGKAAAENGEASPEAGANDTITILVSEFETLKRDVGEWKERCQRNQAEFDNIRKRLRKEADEAGSRAVARSVKPLLNEVDNLGRALEAATPDTFNEFAQGVTLTRQNILSAFQGQGIETVVCEGLFDPTVHEVIAEQESAEVPKGTILQVCRAGYKLKDQLVRSAQVIVAKPPVIVAAG